MNKFEKAMTQATAILALTSVLMMAHGLFSLSKAQAAQSIRSIANVTTAR